MQNYVSKDPVTFMQPENFQKWGLLVTKMFELSQNGTFPHDGILATKMIISVFENVTPAKGAAGLLEPHYGEIFKILMTQLNHEVTVRKKPHREMISMVV